MKEILDELEGKLLTTDIGELILQKAGHRMVKSAHCDTMELDVTLTHLSLPLTDTADTEKMGVKNTAAQKNPQPTSTAAAVCIEGTKYAEVFLSIKEIVQRYSKMNENAGDVTPFIRPSERDFRDVSAFLTCVLLHEKKHMPRFCQNLKLSDFINPCITSSGAREIEVNNELILVSKEFHDFILAYNIAMRGGGGGGMDGDRNPCTSHLFRITKGKCFSFREKYILGLHKNESNSEASKVSDHGETSPGLKLGVAGSAAENQKKTQTRLVDDFVCNVLSEKYPYMNEPPTVKQIENVFEIRVNKSDTFDESAKDYHLWRALAFDRSFLKKN